MIEQIINGINYRLDEETLTAEVIQKDEYDGDIIIPEIVVFEEKTYCVTSIGKRAFENCNSLTSITIPDSVTSIGGYAYWCSALASIAIPDSITSIGNRAFSECFDLKSIIIGNGVTSIGKKTFWNCKSLTNIVVAKGNTVYDSRENCNAIIETATNKLICGCQHTVIPDNVMSIESCAFEGCESLKDIAIPNSVKSIGEAAFYKCESLKSVIIGNGVTSIGMWAFCECESLTTITFQGTIAQWKKIELGNGWNDDIPAKVVHCTDGDVKI